MNKEETNFEINQSEKEQIKRKEYRAPVLTHYGGISELVLAMVNVGGDGADDPAATQSM